MKRFIPQAIEFIEECAQATNARIVVHCRAGESRSAAFVVAYLLHKRYFPDLAQTMQYVKAVRPCVAPNDEFMDVLRQWDERVSLPL